IGLRAPRGERAELRRRAEAEREGCWDRAGDAAGNIGAVAGDAVLVEDVDPAVDRGVACRDGVKAEPLLDRLHDRCRVVLRVADAQVAGQLRGETQGLGSRGRTPAV